MSPRLEIRETIIHEEKHVEGKGYQKIEQVLTTSIVLPDETGIYDTPIGEISVNMKKIKRGKRDQKLVLEGKILGGRVSVKVHDSGYAAIENLGENKELRTTVEKARSKYDPPRYGNPI